MKTDKVTGEWLESPRIRSIRGFDGIVRRVDIPKAREAMKKAMITRESCRSSDEGKNTSISSHATR